MIERQETEISGRYVQIMPDGAEAQLTYSKAPNNIITIDHIGVPPQHRGAGIAAGLLTQAVDDARASNTKIRLICPYATAKFRRHPEWSDLLA